MKRYIFFTILVSNNLFAHAAEAENAALQTIESWSVWKVLSVSVFLSVLIALLIYKLRIKRIAGKKKLLEQQVLERTDKISKQHAELQKKTLELEKQKAEIEKQNYLLGEKTEEILAQRNSIEEKNKQLEKAWADILYTNKALKETNSNLEKKVKERTVKLEKTVDKLTDSNEELDTFLYRASHDLKGPITRLLGLTQLAKLDGKDIGKVGDIDYLDIIEMATIDMDSTLDKLINIHSINTTSLRNDEIDLEELIRQIKKPLAIKISEYDVTIEINHHPEIEIFTDEALLKIILANLLENSVNFRHAKKPRIIISIADDDYKIVIKVEDNGLGIEHDYQEKIFNMFFRGTDTSQGNGLGLYLVKKAVDKLHGTIHVESQEKKFTAFSIIIPKQKSFIQNPVEALVL